MDWTSHTLMNYYHIQIDLDTIDVSNLNRQFLFRREHVGKPKAIIAAEAVRSIAPNVKIVCYHDSVLKYVACIQGVFPNQLKRFQK